jgi:hypothetical protein
VKNHDFMPRNLIFFQLYDNVYLILYQGGIQVGLVIVVISLATAGKMVPSLARAMKKTMNLSI